jgi:hypothetical protein
MFGIRKPRSIFQHWAKLRAYVPPLGERHTICNWVREADDYDEAYPSTAPYVDMQRYGELLGLLPDKVVQNLERARLSRDGRVPMLKAGLGYEELLASVTVDGTPIASSATEAFLFPALLVPPNYLQPGGIPGRTLRLQGRGRGTTLTTSATMTFKVGAALTNVIPTTTWCVSGAIIADAAAQTATMWEVEAHVVVRSVGSAGTVFAMGDSDTAWQRFTSAAAGDKQLNFMGSAGAATPSTATCDMTVAQYLSLTGKWSLSTAYSITGHIFLLEALN